MRSLATITCLLITACAAAPGDSDSQNVSANAIQNGGFESGLASWTSAGTTSASTTAHSGAASAQAGAKGGTGSSSLSQSFTAPAGTGPLTFWYQGFCNDTVTYAWATATLKDTTSGTTATLLARTCTNAAGWKQVTSSALTAGHNYTLTLSNQSEVYKTDYNYTLFDDVSVTGTTAPGNDFTIALSPASATVAPGASATFTVTTSIASGSAETVTLSASGLPAGVTASFNPASVSSGGSSNLTLTAASSAAAASATFTVTGTAASGAHSASGSMTVSGTTSGSDFSLTLSPTSATTTPGGKAQYSVTTGIASGSAESVALSVSGLPPGVSGTFATATITSGQTTTLTLTAASTAGGASGTFVVTGNGATSTHSATASITVSGGVTNDFTIAVSPASQTIAQGSSAAYSITTSVSSGSAQSIALSVSGLPAGVTGAFSSTTISSGGSSTLTLSASSSAAAASSTFTVNAAGASASHSASASVSVSAPSTGIGPGGGSVDHLYFAVVGDTRPANVDQTSSYPTAIINRIYQEIEGLNPRPQFVIGTGDYMYSNTSSGTAQPQINLYMQARAAYSGTFFPAMGNHECDGYTADNCTSTTQTQNIQAFMGSMLAPIQKTTPYYAIPVTGTTGGWTAKLINVACNYWGSAQQSWLTSELASSTTYTILTRHEPKSASTGPCVNSVESLMTAHPYDISLVGHTHTFQFTKGSKEIIVGNGGAPISGSAPYGFITVERLSSSWQVKEYDYSTGLVVNTYSL